MFYLKIIAAYLFFAGVAHAQVITLDFEGLKNRESVLEFYNGGTGSLGSSGVNYGISFTAGAGALIDSDAPGGTGNFANEPSPSTVMTWSSPGFSMNAPSGFATGFALRYTSSTPITVTVYDGLNGSGGVVGTASGAAQSTGNNCIGDPNGQFCNWSELSVPLTGVGRSVVFSGTVGRSAFDNLTFGSTSTTNPSNGSIQAVPTLSEWVMIIMASLMVMFGIRRMRRGS